MLNRTGALLMSVFTAAVIAHPSFERPFHGPPSDDVAFVVQARADAASFAEWEVDCRQAPAKRVYHCDADTGYEEDALVYRVVATGG